MRQTSNSTNLWGGLNFLVFYCQDLYDRNRGGRGLGGFCIMASSWGFDYSQYYPGFPSAYVRMKLGWDFPQIPVAGTNVVANAEMPSNSGMPQLYMIGEEFGFPPGEYLLIENRQRYGLDSLLPLGGLAIYHVDEKAGLDNEGYPGQGNWPQNGLHYRVALLQADGFYNLERGDNPGGSRDFFRGDDVYELLPSNDPLSGPFPNTDAYQGGNVYSTGVEIYGISASGDTMTFEFYHPNAKVDIGISMNSTSSSSSPSLSPSTAFPRSNAPSDVPSLYPTKEPTNSYSSLLPSRSPSLSPSLILPTFSPAGCQVKGETCSSNTDCCQANQCVDRICRRRTDR